MPIFSVDKCEVGEVATCISILFSVYIYVRPERPTWSLSPFRWWTASRMSKAVVLVLYFCVAGDVQGGGLGDVLLVEMEVQRVAEVVRIHKMPEHVAVHHVITSNTPGLCTSAHGRGEGKQAVTYLGR